MDMSFYARSVIDAAELKEASIVKMTPDGGKPLDRKVALDKGIRASQRL